MSSYTPPTFINSGYNPLYFASTSSSNYLTPITADQTYFNSIGGTFSGILACLGGLATAGISNSGSFSTAGDIESSNGIIRGAVDATSISNTGDFTNQGNITSSNGNIISTNGNISGKTLILTPVSTIGANQNTKIISYTGKIDSPNILSYTQPSSTQTITLDNCFRSGLLIGYLQANKKNDNSYLTSYSFIATINYDTGIQGDSGFLSNSLIDWMDYKFLVGYPYNVQLNIKSPLNSYYIITASNNYVRLAFIDTSLPVNEEIVRINIPTGSYTYTDLASAFQSQIQSVHRGNSFNIATYSWKKYTVSIDSSNRQTSINPNPGFFQVITSRISFISTTVGQIFNQSNNFTSFLGFNGNENMVLYEPMKSTGPFSPYSYESSTLSYNFVVFNSD